MASNEKAARASSFISPASQALVGHRVRSQQARGRQCWRGSHEASAIGEGSHYLLGALERGRQDFACLSQRACGRPPTAACFTARRLRRQVDINIIEAHSSPRSQARTSCLTGVLMVIRAAIVVSKIARGRAL